MTKQKTLGRYQVKGTMGKGAMALVLKAYDPRFDRDVAIKVLHRKFSHDPKIRKRFLLEARTIAALDHPAIVPIFDAGQDGEFTFLVMRLMEGGTLHNKIEQGALSFEEIRPILDRVAAALDAAHAQGIVHRDVKPENILFDRYGAAYLSDFGIVKIQDSDVKLTQNQIIGTPAYMSPEQINGDSDIDGRSDIYSLGAVLFEMMTGRLPYNGKTSMQLAMKHITAPVPRLHDHNPDIPIEAQSIISRAMAKQPTTRYVSGSELARSFETLINRSKEAATPAAAAPAAQARQRYTMLFALFGLLALASLGWLAWSNFGPSATADTTNDGVNSAETAQAVAATEEARNAQLAADAAAVATENAINLAEMGTTIFEEAQAQGNAQVDEIETIVAQTLTAQAPPPTETSPPPTEGATLLPTDVPTEVAVGGGDSEEVATTESAPPATGTPLAIIELSSVNVREGPSTAYDSVGFAVAGDELEIIGRNRGNTWYEVQFNATRTGWVAADAARLSNVDNNALPIGNIPPRPTDTAQPPTSTSRPANTPRPTSTNPPTSTPNWAATNEALTRSAPTHTPTATRTPNWGATSAALTAAAPTATTAPTNTPAATATTAATNTPAPTATTAATAAPVPTDTPVSTGPLQFSYFLRNCNYDGNDYVCEIVVTPTGGSGGPYMVEIFDADPPSTYTGVTSSAIHTIRGRRCSPWVHQVQATDSSGAASSQNIFWNPQDHAVFPDGTCTHE